MMNILERAHAYKSLGFAVVPMIGKIPQVSGKPWHDTTYQTLEEMQRAEKKPLALGLISGPLSGVVIVQTFEQFGEDAFARLRGDTIIPAPAWVYKPDNTAFRVYRHCPALETIKNSNPRLRPYAITLRLQGCVTLLPYDPEHVAYSARRYGIPELPPAILEAALGERKRA